MQTTSNPQTERKHYLDPADKMKLEAARDKNGPRPTVSQYNEMVMSRKITGATIRQFGNPDNRTE